MFIFSRSGVAKNNLVIYKIVVHKVTGAQRHARGNFMLGIPPSRVLLRSPEEPKHPDHYEFLAARRRCEKH